MAKVYSWEVSNNTYAYIVDPNDTSRPLIQKGEIINKTKLQTISDWVQNATDTEYDAQFAKMVAECASKNYNVKFEDPSAYRSVTTTCDNLRGPAGRGIKSMEYSHTVGQESVYKLIYDDETYDFFTVKNGLDGKDGIDGTPGAKGDTGVSSKFVMIYTSGVDADGNIITPERPEGGEYNFITGEFTNCPAGWLLNDGDDGELTPPIWQSTRTFASTEESTDRRWSAPVQITGENGKPGEDGTSSEFIYYLGDNPPKDVDNIPSENTPGYVPPQGGFTGSPQGVDEDHLCEYCYTRVKDKETGVWGKWVGPTIWSKYGVNGQDGDGIQYIYLKNKGQVPPNPTPVDFDDSTVVDGYYAAYQDKDTEWLPPVGEYYTNIYGSGVTYTIIEELPEGSEKQPAGIWTDDPTDVDTDFQYIWVSSRKYRKSPDSDKKQWTKFSDPTLWAKFGENGRNATSIRRLYKLTDGTGTPPDLPEDPTMTADWGTGFPKDYKYGENCVWATEAEVWAHNFDFVYSYQKVSSLDLDGKVVPPHDATEENTLEVDYVPDEEITGILYIKDKSNGYYYKWDGGWCEPFLVTGLKGKSGDPVDYVTYVFAFGYADYTPTAPTANDPANPGTSTDEKGHIIKWYDFPDTMIGIDGVQESGDYAGIDMRWYQCEGHVDGRNGNIKENENGTLQWGKVVPCNPRDGEGTPGPYYEFRFAVTKNDKEPETVFINDGKWVREPSYYIDEVQYGWFETDEHMPAIPAGGAMWQIWALIDNVTNEVKVVGGKGWNGPRRVSGEKGETGLQGPAGIRGVSGLPGASQHTLYCLGTYGKEQSEYYFDYYKSGIDKMGDGYFGSKDFQGKTVDELTETGGWYTTSEIPYSDIIQAESQEVFETKYKNPKNSGRVIRFIKTETENVSGSLITKTTHQYYLVGKGGGYYTELTAPLTPEESEEFNVYVWCIQGNDKWTKGKSALYIELEGVPEDANANNTNTVDSIPDTKQEGWKYLYNSSNGKYYTWKEIDGGEVQHIFEGVEWSSPFKLQGTNGLRGLAGNRGQVVYPMGVYNHEEVYITTKEKAPYVYDPNDGLFYVYNIVDVPWVGRLPGYNNETKEYDGSHKTVMIHPDDAEVDYKSVDYNPLEQHEQVSGVKYLKYDDKYFIWDSNSSSYTMASVYKYSSDGGITWMTDQQGDSPANNYANAENQKTTPAWVRFESFQALYTSIGIIANGMIGSAVYNNEFMFSQQGINKQGEKTNYAVVSGKIGDSGFLSGYEYSETPKKTSLGEGKGYIIQNWKYRDSNEYINDTQVNPYEKKNGEYIHGFMPNVCINFATGQMWLQCGKLRFGQLDKDTNVYTQDEVNQHTEEELRKQKELIDADIAAAQEELDLMQKQLDDWDNDGLLNPTEIKLLSDEYETIKLEYPQITGQASTAGVASTDYTNTYKKVTAMTETYYLNPANATATTDTNGAFVSGGDCVVIITGTTATTNWYGWYQKYYEDRQTLLKAISNKLNEKIGDVHNEITAATKTLTDTINANKKEIQEQVDKRADSYYQDADPSTSWQTTDSSVTATYADYRVGDLWFDTGDKKSYTFARGALGSNVGKKSTNNALSAYYWAESDVPAGVYNAINGRSKIFIEKPVPPYYVGDLWFVENDSYKSLNFEGGSGITSGTCMVCVSANTATTGTFNARHWGRRDRYADEAQLSAAQDELELMISQLDDWDDDLMLNPSERTFLESEYDSIVAEYDSIIEQAKTVSLNSSDTAVTPSSQHNIYKTYTATTQTAKHVIADYYLNDSYATAGTKSDCVTIVEGTSDKDKGYGWIKQYYVDRQKLLQAISDRLNNNINETYKKLTADTKTLSDNIAGNLATLQQQVDKRADSYYQDADPSLNWQTTSSATTSTYAPYRVGDLWFDTGDKKSYTFASGSKGTNPGKSSANSALSNYYWAESDVPASVYSSINGRSKIFVSKPAEAYHVGDMWFLEQNYTEKFYPNTTSATTMTKGTIMVCVQSGSTYNANHWGRKDRYADEAELVAAQTELIAMNEQLTAWADDNKISENERTALKRELDTIEAEYPSITSQTVTLGISSESAATDYNTAYTNAVNVFNYYITAATDTTGCVAIVSGTTDTTKGYGWIKNYYEKRQKVLQAISDKLDSDISDVSDKTLLAIGRLNAFGDDNYISPEERKSLKETYNGFSSEYNSILNQAEALGLHNTVEYEYYDYFKSYAENALKYYSSTANTITDSGSDYYGFIKIVNTGTGNTITNGYGNGAKFYGNIAEYYKKKDALQQKITEKLNEKIENVPVSDTEWLTEQFSTGATEYYGGAVLSNFLAVKNQDGNIAAFLNGSSDSPELQSGNGEAVMMLGLGVDGGISNLITLYPWTCPDEVGDDITTIYTTVDYSASNISSTIRNGISVKIYTYSNGELLECPGFCYLQNPETSSSETSMLSDDTTQTLYRTINDSNGENKQHYIYNRATSLQNITENAVKFTPTRMYSDGTVIINNLITTGGEFNGEINANGKFYGTVSSDKGNLNYYNINRSFIKNSDIVLRHDFEETDVDTYEKYNTLTCTDMLNNVLLKMGPANLEKDTQRYTVAVSSVNSYHKNHNGNNDGQWYGTNGSWNSMASFKVNGGETIIIPTVVMDIWIWTSGRKTVKNPSYGLRVSYYSGSTLVSTVNLNSYTTISPWKGGGKGGYSYFTQTSFTKTLTVPTGVNIVKLEYCWKMHLHTYAWLGTDKSAGEITILPSTNIEVRNGKRYNLIEIGGNGMRIKQGTEEKALLFQVMPYGIKLERNNAGVYVGSDPDGDGDSIVALRIPGQQGYREVYVNDDGNLKLYNSIIEDI